MVGRASSGLRAEARSNFVVAVCAKALTQPLPKGDEEKLRSRFGMGLIVNFDELFHGNVGVDLRG
jgi:hypothetical protein